MRVDLLVTERPITPTGTGRAAPRLSWSGVSTDRAQMLDPQLLIRSQADDPGASEITKDQPTGGGPSRMPNNIIGVSGRPIGQTDTPPALTPRCEELECDVVRVSKGQCRVPRRVHDATVGDAEIVEMDFPCSQLVEAGTAESQMIEPRPALVERLRAAQFRELSQTCLLYTSPSPRDGLLSRMPSSA